QGQGQPQEGQSQEGQQPDGQTQEGQAQPGQAQGSEAQGGQAQQGQAKGGQRQPGQSGPGQARPGARNLRGGQPQGGDGAQTEFEAGPGNGNERRSAPLTGAGFREGSDRLRDVEEMVADPELRAEAARIRERARSLRADFVRHSEQPNWQLVQQQVAGP